MLAMTEKAADAVEQLVSQPQVPETAVVRIAAGEDRSNGSGPSQEIQIELAATPMSRDLVVQEMRLAVDPRSLTFLDDKVLDAEVADGEVEFSLHQQPGEPV